MLKSDDSAALPLHGPARPRPDSLLGAFPKRTRSLIAIVLITITLAVCATCSFYSTFSGFQIFDDEGAMLLVLAGLVKGHRLYDQLSVMYGPFGFYTKVAIIKLFHLNVNHNVSRVITWVMTWAGCLIAGLATWRVTRQITGFVLATLTTLFILRSIGAESGHPQDLCQLLIATGALIAAWGDIKDIRLVAILIGVVGGLLMMTKGNLGVFYLAALGTGLVFVLRAGKLRTVLVTLGTIAFLALPYVLLRERLIVQVVFQFFISIECTSIACLLVLFARTKAAQLALRDGILSLSGFVLSAVAIIGFTMLLGTSEHGMVEGLISLPLRASKLLLHVWRQTDLMIPMGVISLGLAIIGTLLLRNGQRRYHNVAAGIALLRFAAGFVSIMAVLFWHWDGQDFVLAATCPFIWLLLFPIDESDYNAPPTFDRIFIALLSITELLGSYPNAGAQQSIGEIVPLCLMVMCVFDGFRWATTHLRDESIELIRLITCAILVTLSLSWTVFTNYNLAIDYKMLSVMALEGSDMIHCNGLQLAEFQTVVEGLKANCDSFMTVPGMNSFYFWTNMTPPTDTNTTNWMCLTLPEQKANYRALQSADRPCILYNHRIAMFWNNGKPDAMNAPIIRWINSDYHVALKLRNWVLLVPNADKSDSSSPQKRSVPTTGRSLDGID